MFLDYLLFICLIYTYSFPYFSTLPVLVLFWMNNKPSYIISGRLELFKTCLYRTINPFSKEGDLVEKLTRNQFSETLARTSYALNRRPLTPISKTVHDF